MKKTISSLLFLATVCFAAPNPPMAEDPMISITPVTRSMGQTGGSAAINTAGSGTWRASTSANWILLTSSSGTAGYPVGYTVGANNGVEARVGYVYVSGYVHTITQAGLGATLDSYSAEFERAGGQGSVQVQAPSGKTWHAASNVDWITVSTTSGTGTRSCDFTVAAYDEVSTRSGTLTIADNTFTVFQTGRRMKLGAAGATTDYFAGTLKIRVNALADTEWAVTVDRDWLTVTDAGSGLGGDEVKVAVAENQSYNQRSGTVTIGTETFAVTQLGRTALVFKIAPTEVEAFGVDGATGERLAVTATPDLGWTAVASADWIEFYEGHASGSGSGSVVYRVKPNPTLAPRSGTITVTAADGAVAAKRLDIAQEAAVASLTVEQYEFEAAGESLAVGVNTGSIVEWGVTNLPAWLSVSAATSTGPAGITLTAAANTSVQPRSATIRIADHEFRVRQKGRGVTVAYEPHVFDADGKATGENADNPITVTADADVTWTAVASDDTWIIVYEGRTGQGNGTVRFIVAPYVGDGEVRTGLITIGSEIVYVTQRPYDLSIDPIGSRVDGNAGAGEIQVALDIDGVWNAIATEPWIAIVSGYDAGTGNGKVLFSYTDNNTGRQRTGKIIVAGETYTLTQAARQLVAVSASAGGRGGTVTGGGTYERDSEIALEAVPEAGYAFDHWVLPGGGTSTENPLSVTVTAAGSYQAVFSPLAPQLAVASASLRGVALEWTDLPWATEWRMFRGTSSDRGQASRIATPANDGTCELLDATGTENQAYWYWVEAVGVEDDVWSNGVQGKREKKSFSIDYTNLRGTTHANPATYREGTAVSFTAPSSRTGFTFLGWTPSGITADTTGDVTARANWAQNEYTVRFDLAGAAGSMADESFTYGLWKYLSPTNFSRPGYTFLGWAVQPTATAAVYDDSESVKSLTAEPDGVVTLYALWIRDGLDDPLPDLGASASSSDIVAVLVGCVDAGNLGANITSAAEYADFRAWADAVRDGSGAAAGHTGVRDSPHAWLSYALGQGTLLQSAPEPGDLVILNFAASESDPSRFDLLFGLDGIAVGSSAKSANLMKTFAIEGAESLEDGFSEDAVETVVLAPLGGDITGSVQPAWDSESFFFRVVERPLQAPSPCRTISFDSAGGSPVAPISQVRGTSVVPPADPTRAGYTFTGWSPAVPATMPDSDTTLVALWTPIQYTIRFDANGGTGEMENLDCFYDELSVESNGLSVKYYDISSFDYSTWTQSETAMKSYFDDKTPTIATNTLDWGETLDSGFSANIGSTGDRWVSAGLTRPTSPACRFHGKYSATGTDSFVAMVSGMLEIVELGLYQFAAVADDAVVVYLDGTMLLGNGQSWTSVATGEADLSSGFHSLSIGFYENYNGQGLSVQWKKPGDSAYAPIPQSALFTSSEVRIPVCTFSKPGCSFVGWATEPDGEVAFEELDPVRDVFAGRSETEVTLYAVLWPAWRYEKQGDHVVLTGVDGFYPSTLALPSRIEGLPVTVIGDYAFQGCSELTSVTIPDSVTSIGYYSFYGCSGLTSITIPDSVTNISYGVFLYCSGLTSIRVDENNPVYSSQNGLLIWKDGKTVIQGVNGDVTIPDGVEIIGQSAFESFCGLTSITIPASVTSIATYAFYSCSGLTSIRVDEDNPVYSSQNGLLLSKDGETVIQGVNGDVTIPDGVTSIGDYAFRGCSELTSVTIPDSVTSIGYNSYYGCSGLTSITIPDSVTKIGDYAFYSCSGLTSIRVDEDNPVYSSQNGLLLSKDGETVIQGVNGDVTIPDSVMNIGEGAFAERFGLTSITIPNSVTNIGSNAFWGCSGLTSFTIPNGVTSIGSGAFWCCSELTSITISDTVTSIGIGAFWCCSGLSSVTIPDSVTNIGERAFIGCSGLTSLTIPDSVTSIGSFAFYDCSGLQALSLPKRFEGHADGMGIPDGCAVTFRE